MSIMSHRPTIKNDRGSMLVQMMVLAAVGIVTLTVVASSILNMYRSQKNVSQSMEADLIKEQIIQLLSNDRVCSEAMTPSSTPMYPDVSGAKQAMSFELPMSVGPRRIAANEVLWGGFIVASVTHQIKPTENSDIVSGAEVLRHYNSTLTVQLRKADTSAFVNQLRPFEIPMHMVVSSTGQGRGCVAVNSGSLACSSQGGIWNPAAADGHKCTALKYCQYAGSYADASEADGGFINALTGGRSCPTGFDAQISGAISKAQSGGKYKVSNQVSRIYTCMKCGTQTAVQTASSNYTPNAVYDMNQFNSDIYAAVEETDRNNYNIAYADEQVALRNWQNGQQNSANLQAAAENADANRNQAQQNETNSRNAFNQATNDYNTANSNLSAAQAAYNAEPSDANSQAVVNAQNARNAAETERTRQNDLIPYYQNQQTMYSNAAADFRNQKQAQDQTNQNLEAIYLAKKAESDTLYGIWQRTKQEIAAGREPTS